MKRNRMKFIPITYSVASYTPWGKKNSNTIYYKFLLLDGKTNEELIEKRKAEIFDAHYHDCENIQVKVKRGEPIYVDGIMAPNNMN